MTREQKPKQRKEPVKAAAAFEMYAAMGYDRSFSDLAKLLGKEPGYVRTLQKWAKEFNWNDRLIEYDAKEIEKEKERERKAHEREIKELNKRHAIIARAQQAKAIETIQEIMKAKSFGSLASVQLLKLALDLERLALGADKEPQKVEVTGQDGGEIIIRTVWGTPKVNREGAA